MKFKVIKASNLDKNLKCTVHKSGKLGFTEAAITKLDIENKRYMYIGTNDDDPNDTNLYILLKRNGDDDSFKTNKAGNYYYANTKELFDQQKIDYLKKSIIFDISETNETDEEGDIYYRLKRREKERK